jgi:hypothetical protein
MTTTRGVFLPDEQEHQITKKPPQSVRTNGAEGAKIGQLKADHADPGKLNEQELKAAIISAWKKHEALAKTELAPLLYWLRERLRAQGARNDLTQDKHRGWELWVTTHLDISRSTADAWCAWYAKEAGLVPAERTSTDVGGSEDDGFYEDIVDKHKGRQKITVSYYLPKTVYSQYQKALTKIQNKFGLENKNEAVVQGVIYAATVIEKRAAGRGASKVVGDVSVWNPRRANAGNKQVRKGARSAHGGRKAKGTVPVESRSAREAGHKQSSLGTNGRGGEGSEKARGVAAGR